MSRTQRVENLDALILLLESVGLYDPNEPDVQTATLKNISIDLKTKKPVIANKMGGFSGPAIFPAALRMVYQVYDAVKIPVVGIGGIATAEQVIEMMLAGACAVQIGAANLVDPYVCRNVIRDLPEVMKKYGIAELKYIIGGAHNG